MPESSNEECKIQAYVSEHAKVHKTWMVHERHYQSISNNNLLIFKHFLCLKILNVNCCSVGVRGVPSVMRIHWMSLYMKTCIYKFVRVYVIFVHPYDEDVSIKIFKCFRHFRWIGYKYSYRYTCNKNVRSKSLPRLGDQPSSIKHDDVIEWKHFPRY